MFPQVQRPYGPLLSRILELQLQDDDLASPRTLRAAAKDVLAVASRLDRPILIAAGPAADRILGAVSALWGDAAEAQIWTRDVRGRVVLIVGTVAATLVEFELLAKQMRSQGAVNVHACAIQVDDMSGGTASTLFTCSLRAASGAFFVRSDARG